MQHLRAKIFPSCEKCFPVHFCWLHEFVHGDGDLERQLVRLPVHAEAYVQVCNEEKGPLRRS